MIYVVDTHALFWFLVEPRKLGQRGASALQDAYEGRAFVYVPMIVMSELQFMLEKNPPKSFASIERSF